jgi:thiaminase/transcriptional activator TenA
MAFSAELREHAAPIWNAQLEHPFVRGIGDGTLPEDAFRYFLLQDYVFLVEYARLLALGCARAPSLAAMRRLAELAQSVLTGEMELHRKTAAEWGIAAEELERVEPAPATRAYTDFLLKTATLGDFGELAAALLPCIWGYSELGRALADGPRPADDRHARWIDEYASDEFAELAAWCRALVDDAAAGAGAETRARMREAFLESSRHELAFWEAAWRGGSA